MHYLVAHLEQHNPSLLTLGTDVPHLAAAARLTFAQVEEELAPLKVGLVALDAEAAAAATDPTSIRREKESAQATFREARNGASSTEAVEAAARDWLSAINRINVVVKEAGAEAAREHHDAAAMVPTILPPPRAQRSPRRRPCRSAACRSSSARPAAAAAPRPRRGESAAASVEGRAGGGARPMRGAPPRGSPMTLMATRQT